MGIKVESEHITTYNALKRFVDLHKTLPPPSMFFAMIAKDHLLETPDYYTKLVKIEVVAGRD